jgi:hypothetical protein
MVTMVSVATNSRRMRCSWWVYQCQTILTPDYGVINEYLDEYRDSYSVDEDLEHGYIRAVDYDNPTITYTSEEILQLMSVFEDTKK